MSISRWHSIPRFALPYTPGDFIAALEAIVEGAPLPETFALVGDSPKFWTRSGRQALRLLLGALELPAGLSELVWGFAPPSRTGRPRGMGDLPATTAESTLTQTICQPM